MKIAAFVPFDEESICYGLIDGENIREINDPFTGEERRKKQATKECLSSCQWKGCDWRMRTPILRS